MQGETLNEIWASLDTSVPRSSLALDDFLWGWLCTNSRCVYMDLGYLHHEDNFTLAPLFDMANHTAVSWLECKVRYDAHGVLELLAPQQPRPDDAGRRGWQKGDEVCITYGAHANSLLLAEYGFVLPSALHACAPWPGNRFSDVVVDEAVRSLLGAQGDVGTWKRALLEREGYWKYVLLLTSDYSLHPYPAPAHPSYRLTTALQLACMGVEPMPSSACTDGGTRTRRDAERQWLLVVQGLRESVSPATQKAMEYYLQFLCTATQAASEAKLARLREHTPLGDAGQTVEQILLEEQAIAALVQEATPAH